MRVSKIKINTKLKTITKKKIYSIVILLIIVIPIFFQNIRSLESNKGFQFEEDALTFVACGDPHYGWTNTQFASNIVDAWMNDPNIEKLDFAFNMGDFTHFGAPYEYAVAMKSSFGKMLLPYMFVFGNHDTADYKTNTGRQNIPGMLGLADPTINTNPYDAIKSAYNATGINSYNYAFLWDDILFLIFGDQGTTMLLTNEQREWLIYMTNRYHNYTTITVSHQGFYTELYSKDPYQFYNDFDWWQNFIENNPQIILHIQGHNHQFKHYKYFGLDAIDTGITNGVGKPWTVIFQITNHSIRVGIYDVLKKIWINNNLFSKEISTTFNRSGVKWYSFLQKVQNNQELTFANRIIAKKYKAEIISANPNLVNQNEEFKFWYPKQINPFQIPIEDVYWIGFYNDENNPIENECVIFNGEDIFSTSIRPALRLQPWLGWYTKWTEGKVPDSTTPLVFTGNTYNISCRFKADSYASNSLDVFAEIYSENLSSPIYGPVPVISNATVTTDWQWIYGNIELPKNDPNLTNAWILRLIWKTKTQNKFYLDSWNVKLANSTDYITSFQISINNKSIISDNQVLNIGEFRSYELNPAEIENINKFKFNINGSGTALFRLIYENPIIWSDDFTFGILNKNSDYNYTIKINPLTVCADSVGYSISPYSKLNMNSNISSNWNLQNIKNYYNAWTLSTNQIFQLGGFPIYADIQFQNI
ncbi:MAG: metallophosphoesterase family protein [Promethearchaeota archaeon]